MRAGHQAVRQAHVPRRACRCWQRPLRRPSRTRRSACSACACALPRRSPAPCMVFLAVSPLERKCCLGEIKRADEAVCDLGTMKNGLKRVTMLIVYVASLCFARVCFAPLSPSPPVPCPFVVPSPQMAQHTIMYTSICCELQYRQLSRRGPKRPRSPACAHSHRRHVPPPWYQSNTALLAGVNEVAVGGPGRGFGRIWFIDAACLTRSQTAHDDDTPRPP